MAQVRAQPRTPWSSWRTKNHAKRWEMFARKFIVIPDGHGSGEPMVVHKPQRQIRQAITDHLVTVMVVGKGNTKSSTAASVALHWVADPPPGDRIPAVEVVAGSREQATVGVYKTCSDMIEASPELWPLFNEFTTNGKERIESLVTNGAIKLRAPTPERLHGIKPSLGLVDELGLIRNPKVWRTMVQSLGKRPGARLFGFGTPGWERGELWRLRQLWERGELDKIIYWLEWSGSEGCDTDNRAELLAANPMRAALDPAGWFDALMVIRAAIPEDEFRIFHLAQWPEMTGIKLVAPDRWAELADPDKDDHPPLRFVAIEGDYSRRNLAVVSADAFDGHAHLHTEAVWEHQEQPVPVGEIVAAVLERGPAHGATLRTSGQLDDVATALEAEGIPVERLDTHSAAKMRTPTDQWLEAVTSGELTHDGNDTLTKHLGNTRLEPRREGLTLARDERAANEEAARVDAALAAIVAISMARSSTAPVIY